MPIVKIIASINNLHSKEVEVTYELDDLVFSNSSKYRNDFLRRLSVRKFLGEHVVNVMSEPTRVYAYGEFELDKSLDSLSDYVCSDHVLSQLRYMQDQVSSILAVLWYVRDHNASVGEIVGYIENRPGTICIFQPSDLFYKADFSSRESFLAIDDSDKILSIFSHFPKATQRINSVEKQEGFAEGQIQKISTPSPLNHDELNRIERALLFLTLARTQAHLPFRIALFVPIFEALFSNDAAEVTYKVAHRAAVYLGSEKDERIDIFKKMKQVYNIRSRFIHGDTLSSSSKKGKAISHEQLLEMSVFIDNLTRKLMTKVIVEDAEKFLLPKEEISQYFDDLAFPTP